MGRTPRAHLPGVAFHLTARLQNREPLFLGSEARIVDLIGESARHCDVQLLALAVMPNHLHLIVVQGRLPLARLMQPLLRRVASLVARKRRREGHIFERRYHDNPCLDAGYLRNAIAYVHLNPVRAQLCTAPDAYPWTSHQAYASTAVHPALVHSAVEAGLQLFARRDCADGYECRSDYRMFVGWRQAMDRYLDAGGVENAVLAPRRPFSDGGDSFWAERFGDAAVLANPQLIDRKVASLRADLCAIGRGVLISESRAPEDLNWLRSGGRGPALAAARRTFVRRSIAAGYANTQIARFLRVSPGCVSLARAVNRSMEATIANGDSLYV
jgi:REP element-mobilizing transposase RayT